MSRQNIEACRKLMIDYCYHRDVADFEGLAALFAEAGQLEISGRQVKGRGAIRDFMAARAAGPTFHLPSAISIVMEGADEASATSRVLVLEGGSDSAAALPAPVPSIAAIYVDRFVREAGSWRFSSRRTEIVFARR